MGSSVSIICNISDFFLVCKFKNLSVNYVLHFGSVKMHKHCLYWSVFSTDINGKIIFNYFLLFSSFLQVSKLYESSQ